MITIWKFQLPIMERAIVSMPEGAHIIRVDGLDGALWLWAVVDTEAEYEDREFLLFKTGASIDDTGVLTYPKGSVILLDKWNVHRPPVIQESGFRTFVKVSISKEKYNLKGNAHNYLFPYNWEMYARQDTRNHPVKEI